MRLSYHPDTDSLYIHLSDRQGVDVVEVSEDVVVDVDADRVPVGVDVASNASKIVDLSHLELDGFSLENLYLDGGPKDQKAVS